MKEIKEFEGKYSITNDGRVWSHARNGTTKKGRFIKTWKNRGGYILVSLLKDKKLYAKSVHRLVALHYIKTNNEMLTINHKDGDKTNNHYSNLEWCTQKENRRHAIKNGLWNLSGEKSNLSKLTDKDVISIRKLRLQGKKLVELADQFGVTFGQIGHICKGKVWKHLL